ncbi:MAG TPA: acyltransferase [Acidiphilium sp.]|nr:acyltransferase [Acidiphilium sp.]
MRRPVIQAPRDISARQSDQTTHYLVLDGMRGIAAVTVLAFHITEYFRLPFKPVHGYLAVDFFFMLSGFVIAHAYDRQLRGGMGFPDFLRLRLIRLYPLAGLGVLLGTAGYLVAASAPGGPDAGAVLQATLANALLLPTRSLLGFRPWAFPLDTPLWSLSIELLINILYALYFRWLTRASLLATCVFGAVLMGATALHYHGLNAGYRWIDLWAAAARVVFPFTAGLLMRRALRPSMAAAPGRLARRGAAHATVPLLLLLLAAPLPMEAWFDIAAVLLAFPALVAAGAFATPSRRLDPIWKWLGALSYPLYVLHYPLVAGLANLTKHHLHRFAPEMALFAALASIGLAWAAGRFYDVPLRRWLTGAGRTTARLPAAVPPGTG